MGIARAAQRIDEHAIATPVAQHTMAAAKRSAGGPPHERAVAALVQAAPLVSMVRVASSFSKAYLNAVERGRVH